MANTRQSVLTEDHFNTLKNGLDAANSALDQIELAKQAGLNVDQFEQGARETRDKLLKIKNVYFPGR